jgi:hypothetical protein
MAPTLPDMPVEIFDHIIDQLPHTWNGNYRRHDLKNLRSASRKLENRTRIRFGKEFFRAHMIRIGPGSFRISHNVLNDADCRKSPRTLVISFGRVPLDETADYEVAYMYASRGRFKSALNRCMSQSTRLESIILKSPRVLSEAPEGLLWTMNWAWWRVVRDTLCLLSVHTDLPLRPHCH